MASTSEAAALSGGGEGEDQSGAASEDAAAEQEHELSLLRGRLMKAERCAVSFGPTLIDVLCSSGCIELLHSKRFDSNSKDSYECYCIFGVEVLMCKAVRR